MLAPRRALQRVVKLGAAAADVLERPRPGVTVLIYHRVGGGSGLEVDLDPSVFDEQMARLAVGATVLPLGAALDLLPQPANGASPRPVVVTFDDGTADFVDVALPILVRHAIPVTLYAATAFIDDGVPFPHGGAPTSWSALADAMSTGLVEVGSHTHTHRLLDRCPDTEVADELDRSIGLIADRLGRRPADFAYPKAVPGAAGAAEAVRARFRSAALAGTRPNPFGATDPHRLARSPIQRADRVRWFDRKVAGGMAREDDLRRLLNRHRYATATT